MRLNPEPRWSVVIPAARALLPALMAALPPSSAIVCVGPPLLASAARFGSIGAAAVPTMLLLTPLVRPLFVPTLIRLKLLAALAADPPQSLRVEFAGLTVLSATIVPSSVTFPLLL